MNSTPCFGGLRGLALWQRGGLCAALVGLAVTTARAGALEDYVQKPDPCFHWKCTEQKAIRGGTLSHLELISQVWRGLFWSHHLMVLRPHPLRHPDIAMLFITGGSYGAPSEKDLALFQIVAQRAGAIVGVLNHVPNEPLYNGRREDALIAYTFDRYLKTGDPTWPLLFPMVKSAVRGMDTLQQFAQQQWGQHIRRFVVSGASKRGWTTWLTGAVDPRVVGIAPMVIDMLNMKAQLKWQKKVYGRPSSQIDDYIRLHLHLDSDEPGVVQLRDWVDPYSYRKRYTMPKLILLGTNDPYWTVDSLSIYWKDLPSPKLVFQTPNAGHGLAGGKEAVQTLASWFQMLADHQSLPKLTWHFTDGSTGDQATVHVNEPALAVKLWTAESPNRDFRPSKWSAQTVPFTKHDGTEATVEVPRPASGWRAFLLEVTLRSSTGQPYRLSTAAHVTPDTLP